MEASFIVEFALEHGVGWRDDPTATAMLTEFMQRVQEWGGHDTASADTVKALISSNLPPGPAAPSLSAAVLSWVDENPMAAVGVGLALGGLAAVLAGVAVASARGARRR